ncbi:MAG: glycosyltransferase [Peptococcaceae bacterium]|nr:glycosyltransferase [Peptococcaceae bacterium]
MKNDNFTHEMLQQELDQLKEEVSYYKDAYYDVLKQQERLEIHNKQLQESYDSVVNSTCWKLTKPIRVILDFMKNSFSVELVFKGLKSVKENGIKLTWRKVKNFLNIEQQSQTIKEQTIINNFQDLVQFIESRDKTEGSQIIHPDILKKYDGQKNKKVILLISHEAGLTGAPIALYRLAQTLKKQGKYPVFLTPETDILVKELEKEEIPVIVYKNVFKSDFVFVCRKLFNIIFVNTIVPCSVVSQLNGTDTQVVWWIHEARASYDMTYRNLLPQSLSDNIQIYTAGPYAKKVLQHYRPEYKIEELLYMVPDFSCDESEFDFGDIADGKTIFASVGTLAERKGQDVLVQAIKMLEPAVREKSLFVFVGKKFSEKMEAAVREAMLHYPQNVVYLGEMSQQRIHAMYRKIDCLICSSSDDPMPIVVTEAFCASKLVICSENTGSASIIEHMHAGYIYSDNSPVQLAAKITQIVQGNCENASLRENARKAYKQYFSRNVFENNVDKIVEGILEKTHVKKRVSVIIPTYNAGKQFEELLEILNKQKHLDFLEIVVVDSGSRDNTVALCENYNATLIQISNEEFSHSYARNLGAEKAKGDILLFMTQDAMPSSDNWVAEMIAPIIDENIAAVSCREKCPADTELYYKISSEIHAEFMGFSHEDKTGMYRNGYDELSLRKNANLNDVACAVQKKIFQNFQYRYDFAEDLDLGVRLIKKGYAIKFLSNVAVIHGHNRSAEYYLKRSLVETLSLDLILNRDAKKLEKTEQEFLYLILAYGTTKYAVEKMRKQKVTDCSVELFFEYLDKSFAEAFSQKASFYVNTCRKLPADNKVDEIISKLAEGIILEREGSAYNAAQHLRHYAKHHIKKYMLKSESMITKELEEKIYDALEKQLATFIGSEISHLHPDARMYSLIAELKKGV